MLVLSYLGLLALIPLLSEKDDADLQWHAKHGLVISAASAILLFVAWVISLVVAAVIPVVGCVGCVLPVVALLAVIGVHVAGMMKALKGERLLIPGVSEFANKF